MPLEGDWQRAELARSVTLPILRWPNPAAAEADGERKAAADGRFPTRAAVYPGRWAHDRFAAQRNIQWIVNSRYV